MLLYAVQYTYDQRTDLRIEHRPAHRDYLQQLADQGKLLGSGPYTDGEPGALLIFAAADRAELDRLIADDPLSTVGVIAAAEVREWDLLTGPWAP